MHIEERFVKLKQRPDLLICPQHKLKISVYTSYTSCKPSSMSQSSTDLAPGRVYLTCDEGHVASLLQTRI